MRLARLGRLHVFFRRKVFKVGYLVHKTAALAGTPVPAAEELRMMRVLGIAPPVQKRRPGRLLYRALYLGQWEFRLNAGR